MVEDQEKALWQTAAQEYLDILMEWPSLAPAWRREGQDVILKIKAMQPIPAGNEASLPLHLRHRLT